MRNRLMVAALAAVAFGLGAPPSAAAAADSGSDAVEVRVVNNHVTPVRVFVEDADGKLHSLGRVARGQYRVMTVDAAIAARGPVQVKFFRAEPAWSALADGTGIRTRAVDLSHGGSVTAFLETELTASVLEVEQSIAG